jgi:glycosyltransferase involved in cell wall biosynthesis
MVSKYMCEKIESSLQFEIKKWYLLYYGTDCLFFKRNNTVTNESSIFLQISSFAEKKGHIFSVQAFKRFLAKSQCPNCTLILAGEGPEKDNVMKVVKDLNLKDRVFFPGLVDRYEAKQLMQNANFFVHHSITSVIGDTEGIPNAIMEAMAMELPVISTYHAGIPELVEDGVNGLLVQEKDVEAYAEAMEKILSWGYLPQNREKIKKYFEKEKHGAQLESYYEEAIEEMKKRAQSLPQ